VVKQVDSRAYLSRFNFGGGEQNKSFGNSGGERNRLPDDFTKEEGNVLLLEEPT
jgi:ATPase subunit of ABC transporter with duplicated ATPase domains